MSKNKKRPASPPARARDPKRTPRPEPGRDRDPRKMARTGQPTAPRTSGGDSGTDKARANKRPKRHRHRGHDLPPGIKPKPLPSIDEMRARARPSPAVLLAEPEAENEGTDSDFARAETSELGFGSRMIPPDVAYEAELAPPPSTEMPPRPRAGASPAELEAQIRALEARLDGLIRRAAPPSEPPPPSLREQVEQAALDVVESIAPLSNEPALADRGATGYVERQWGREALRSRVEEVDDFGLDPEFEAKLRPGMELLYRRYFRVQVEGIENVPSNGRAVIVANHGGALPLDGAMLRTAMRLDHPSGRDLRWLAEDFVFYLPFAGVFLNRIGAVRACPENAQRLLEKDGLVAVFPEGVHGIKKLFRERYQLQRFGRGGYIRLCLKMRAPLIPCAIIGAEEASPLLYRLESLAAIWKLPYLPITPTFPLLGPLGLVPAPTRWKLRFGEPISFENYGPEALDDHLLVGRLSERVRAAIQSLLDSGLSQRKSVWFG